MQLPAQTLIGEYQIERHLARGGMADIYLAHHVETGEAVAIKMVSKSLEDYCLRFHREVAALSKLSHEHILPVLDYGEYQEWCYLITPYIAYGTLRTRLANGPLSVQETGKILQQLAPALHEAHINGIIHRDIKPSNILMQDGTYVYLADFGILKSTEDLDQLTRTGFLIGTPEYMPPELAEKQASPQSDIYALGIALFEMLTGQVPFKGSTPLGVYLKQVRETPPSPSSLNATIPSAIETVILKALNKQPSQRYQTVLELNEAYQQALNQSEQQALASTDQNTLIGALALTKQKTQISASILSDNPTTKQKHRPSPISTSKTVAATKIIASFAVLFIVASTMLHFVLAGASGPTRPHTTTQTPAQTQTTPRTQDNSPSVPLNTSGAMIQSQNNTSTDVSTNHTTPTQTTKNQKHNPHTNKTTPSPTTTPVTPSPTPPVLQPTPTLQPTAPVQTTPTPSPTVGPSPTVEPTVEPSPTAEPTVEPSPTVTPDPIQPTQPPDTAP